MCVGGGGGVKNQRTSFAQQIFTNTLSVPLLNTGAQFFLTADESGPTISPHQHRLAFSPDEMAFIKESGNLYQASARFRCGRL